MSEDLNLVILTSGLEHDLVAKKIGEAVSKKQQYTYEGENQSKAKIRCIGITSWGALKIKPREVYRIYTIYLNK